MSKFWKDEDEDKNTMKMEWRWQDEEKTGDRKQMCERKKKDEDGTKCATLI